MHTTTTKYLGIIAFTFYYAAFDSPLQSNAAKPQHSAYNHLLLFITLVNGEVRMWVRHFRVSIFRKKRAANIRNEEFRNLHVRHSRELAVSQKETFTKQNSKWIKWGSAPLRSTKYSFEIDSLVFEGATYFF